MIYYGFWFSPGARRRCRGSWTSAARRDRHRAAQALQGQRDGGRPARRRARSTGPTSRPSRPTRSIASATPRASSTSTRSGSRSARSGTGAVALTPMRVDVALTAGGVPRRARSRGASRSWSTSCAPHHDRHRAATRLPAPRAGAPTRRGAPRRWPRATAATRARRGAGRRAARRLRSRQLAAEFTADRVGGRTVVLTTSNGTARAAGRRARRRRPGVAALINVTAAARWAARAGPRRDHPVRGRARGVLAGGRGVRGPAGGPPGRAAPGAVLSEGAAGRAGPGPALRARPRPPGAGFALGAASCQRRGRAADVGLRASGRT